MNFEDWLVESHLSGKYPLPRLAVHGFLYLYLNIYNRIFPWFGSPTSLKPEETDEIAARSKEVMEVHYDRPLEWFTEFLGPTMKYSMGLWEEGAESLEAAQTAMMEDVCQKANIQPGHSVLDIGCGFGSLAEYILRTRPGAKVTGLTMSDTQANYIRERMVDPGHIFSSDRFRLIQADFNHIQFEIPFNRIVSLGLFEHVSNLNQALKKIRGFTAPNGYCFLHYIVYQPHEGEGDHPRIDPFMERYIFPGGRIHAYQELLKYQNDFEVIRNWYLSGRNYSRTARSWLANFLRKPSGTKGLHPDTARQRRIWEFFLRSCEVLFTVRGGFFYGNGQYLLRPIAKSDSTHIFSHTREFSNQDGRASLPES